MKVVIAWLILWVACIVASDSADLVSKHVIEFDDTVIEETLAKAKFSLIYFGSDICKYCGEFEPDFQFLSILYNNVPAKDDFQVLKTNARKNPELSRLFLISQYPTIKLLEFGTKRIHDYTKPKRDIYSLIGYIEETVGDESIKPNFDNFNSNLHYISTEDGFNALTRSNSKDVLVVFTKRSARDWDNYDYPSHFYQRLAIHPKLAHLQFALVDIDKLEDLHVLERFHVSNFPSAIYFRKNGKGFKTFKTLSQNFLNNLKLLENELKGFIENVHSLQKKEYGEYYKNEEHLKNAADQMGYEYDGYKNIAPGFNVRQQDEVTGNSDLETEYLDLLHHIEL